MAGAAPRLKAQDLSERINQLSRDKASFEPVNEWAWRLVMKDVERLETVGGDQAVFALLLKAVMWGLKTDSAQMEACFNKYSALHGQDWRWHRLRSTQGPSIGRLDMVLDMLSFGYPKGSPSDIISVAKTCNQAGLFKTSASIAHELHRLGAEGALNDDRRLFSHIPSTLSYMAEHNLDEMDIARRIETATRVVLEMSGPLSTFAVASGDFGITFEYTVNADIERLVDIDMAISEALASKFEDTLSRHLSISVIPPGGAA